MTEFLFIESTIPSTKVVCKSLHTVVVGRFVACTERLEIIVSVVQQNVVCSTVSDITAAR